MPRPITFFGGKGGVGKTTLASAYALSLAAAGHRTLLVSTDPAHSTSDLLGLPLGNTAAAVTELLWAVEVDAAADAAAYVERIKGDARATLSREVASAVERHLDVAESSPGTVESALFDRVAALMAQCPADYDRIVFDTAPTGHTLRLLALPGVLGRWIDGLVGRRRQVAHAERLADSLVGPGEAPPDDVGDPILDRLTERRERLAAARRRLVEDAAFHLVVVLERLALAEAQRAATTLAEHGIGVATVVVNRVLPAEADGTFLAPRRERERTQLEELPALFPRRRLVTVTQRAAEPRGLDDLAATGRELLAGGLPA